MRDAAATRRRLLEAATAEFAEFGIAGARVDRIVAAARSNKAQLYAYYTSKDLLFDAVFETFLDQLITDVPMDAHALGDYAVDLYDAILRAPAAVRLATWRRLERVPTGHLFGDVPIGDQPKVAAIAAAQQDGSLDETLEPVDVLAMVTALALTWSPASTMIAASNKDPSHEQERRRRALKACADRAFTAESRSTGDTFT